MHLPKSQHKVILLFARLMELEATGAPIAGGRIALTDNSHKIFVLRTNSGEQRLVPFDEIERHCAVRKPQSDKKLTQLDKIVHQVFPGQWSDRNPVSSDKVLVSEFSQGIGIDRGRSRYIIDYIHASQLPTFSSVTQKAKTAHDFTERYGGLYFVYRHDINDATRRNNFPRGAIVRSTLSIRYPVPYKPHASDRKGECRIRCKLTIPGYGRQWKGPIRYDGYVGTKGPWHQFLLQARRDPSRSARRPGDDLILMYTEALSEETSTPTPFTYGVMLTQNQEIDMTPTVSSVVIERQPEYRVRRHLIKGLEALDPAYEYLRALYKLEPSDESSFMNINAKVFSPHDPQVSRASIALFEGWGRLNTLGLHR